MSAKDHGHESEKRNESELSKLDKRTESGRLLNHMAHFGNLPSKSPCQRLFNCPDVQRAGTRKPPDTVVGVSSEKRLTFVLK